jgi:mono/diheme cytochrome c family protein
MRRFSRATNQLLLSGTLAATAVLAVGFSGCTSDEGTTATCISTEELFAQVYFQELKDKCASCHQVGGPGSGKSDFDLRPPSEAGYLEANMEAVRALAKTVSGEKSIFLQKPVGGLGHEGGKVLAEDSASYRMLEDLVDKLANDDTGCPNTEARYLSGAELMNPMDTLRKASLVLAARLPTAEEEAAVKKGGFEALDGVLDGLMEEQAFYTRLEEKFNDVMHTDFYLREGLGVFGGGDDGDEMQSPYDPQYYLNIPDTAANRAKYGVPPGYQSMYDNGDGSDFYAYLADRVQEGVAQQPLKLVSYIIRNNRPYTEIANANYMVVTPFSAPAYGITDVAFQNDADPYEYQAARIGGYESGYPHAGIMSDIVWLARHPTTPTNRNRHRAKEAMYLFLANDILKAAERPIDITAVQRAQNPTVNDGNCSQCHRLLDPIAASWRNFQSDDPDAPVFLFDSEFGWYNEMWQPGFKEVAMPPSVYVNALPWGMNMVAQDPGMAFGGVYMAFRAFVGSDPLTPPSDPKDPDYQADLSAYLGQYYTISKIATNFREKHGYNFKKMVKEVVMSPYFRAKNTAPDISELQLSHLGALGSAHLLTPEQLNRKLENVLGMPWGNYDNPNLLGEYKILFGGIDSVETTARVTDPNGIMANIIERMSLEAGCDVIGAEFSLPMAERKLFTSVESNMEPLDANGYEIPENAAAIKATIVHMHQYLLGDTLAVTDPEITRTFNLFVETWKEGKALVNKEMEEGGVGGGFRCGINYNYITGVPFGETAEGDKTPHIAWRGGEEGGSNDPLYVGRAWMAVMVYMLTDTNFVYEM